MERVQDLIDKLYQQRLRNEAPLQLLPTVQQLYDALLIAAQKSINPKSEKVAVVMPTKPRVSVRTPHEESGVKPTVVVPPQAPAKTAAHVPAPVPAAQPAPAGTPPPQPEPVVAEAPPVTPAPLPKPEPQPQHAAVNDQPLPREAYALQKPVISEPPTPKQEQPAPVQPMPKEQPAPVQPEAQEQPEPGLQPNLFGGHFDAGEEAPTLLQQEPKQPPKEIHELISEPQESLNDRLKQERTELAHVLKDTPIKDLRKAIGVNDKFLFVNELFRGDEAMYERSIKTINSFHIFPEAEYWINRELKVKLGWNDSSQTVKHFYNLVRRRFS